MANTANRNAIALGMHNSSSKMKAARSVGSDFEPAPGEVSTSSGLDRGGWYGLVVVTTITVL